MKTIAVVVLIYVQSVETLQQHSGSQPERMRRGSEMKYTKEQIAKVACECAKQEALHDNEYLGKIGCMLDDLLGRVAELEKDALAIRGSSPRAGSHI